MRWRLDTTSDELTLRLEQEWETTMAGEKMPESLADVMAHLPRFCIDCQFFATDGTHMCMRPIVSPVTGEVGTLSATAHHERLPTGSCGPHGGFFRKKAAPLGAISHSEVEVGLDMRYATEDDGA